MSTPNLRAIDHATFKLAMEDGIKHCATFELQALAQVLKGLARKANDEYRKRLRERRQQPAA